MRDANLDAKKLDGYIHCRLAVYSLECYCSIEVCDVRGYMRL